MGKEGDDDEGGDDAGDEADDGEEDALFGFQRKAESGTHGEVDADPYEEDDG